MANREQRRQGAKARQQFDTTYRRNLEVGTEQLQTELNATRIALAIMLDRAGGEVIFTEADLKRVSGRRIQSEEIPGVLGVPDHDVAPIGSSWRFRLATRSTDA